MGWVFWGVWACCAWVVLPVADRLVVWAYHLAVWAHLVGVVWIVDLRVDSDFLFSFSCGCYYRRFHFRHRYFLRHFYLYDYGRSGLSFPVPTNLSASWVPLGVLLLQDFLA